MFRFVFRFVGLMLIALSFLFVVQDGTKSIADQTVYISRVASTWENIHPSSLSAFEPAVEKLAGAWVWSDVIQPYFLQQPTALILVIIGAVLVLLGSKKKSRIAYARH
jgi:ABC-type thiamin/hydroxymethylpyrimidine transport system permease subunit